MENKTFAYRMPIGELLLSTVYTLYIIQQVLEHRSWLRLQNGERIELVSKQLNHLEAILHVYAGGLNFMQNTKRAK